MAKDQERQQLEATIQRLQDELAQLKAATMTSPQPQSSRAPHDAWVIDIIKQLLADQRPDNLDGILARIGAFFACADCSFWQWSDQQHQLTIAAHWAEPKLATALGEPWLAELTRSWDAAAADNLLLQGEALPAVLRTAGIQQSLIIPIIHDGLNEGYVSLSSRHEQTFSDTDLEHLTVMADLLFSARVHRRVMQSLADRDTRFQYAMDASRDGLWDWDIKANKVYLSRSYLRMFGYRRHELPSDLQELRARLLHPDDAERVREEQLVAMRGGRSHLNQEFRMLHRDGRVLWIYSRAKFVERDESGMPQRCVGLNADISDFIRTREELLAAKAEADIANRTKSEFLARMSHEIRTPMNAIIGLGHLLRDTSLDEQQKSYLSSLSTAAESLLHIINQVLDFSKIESGKIILERAHFDLDQVFEKLTRLFEISAVHRTVDIVYDIKHDVPRFLRGDAPRLSQVIGQLMANALQYSTTNQVVVSVRTLEADSKFVTLEFCITDFGVGMNEIQVAQLQSQLEKTGGEEKSHGGFGLNICQHLVSLMEGSIQIDSKPGHGCKISFTARFENSQMGSKSLQQNTHALSKLRALIVDDNTIARNIVASTAHSIRLHTDTSDSAPNALEKIRRADASGNPYHLVLLDYKMPLINGLQAASMIKADNTLKTTPLVILISSFHRDEIFKDDENAVLVDGFLSKPVSESRLFDTINQAIGKTHPLRALMTPANMAGADAADSDEDDQILRNLNVLLAEDNLVNQQVARGILTKKGIRVMVASNGREAVECLQHSDVRFDLVLMDLEMPELDGYQATQAIREGNIQPDIPIIAVTAQAMRGDRERCLAAGMDGYLSKPIMPDMLYRTLADMMRTRAGDAQNKSQ